MELPQGNPKPRTRRQFWGAGLIVIGALIVMGIPLAVSNMAVTSGPEDLFWVSACVFLGPALILVCLGLMALWAGISLARRRG